MLQENHPELSYRTIGAVLLEGELQARVLEKALYEMVQRHEILRTTFQRPQGVKTPFQVVSENSHPSWQAIDLSHLTIAQQDSRIETFLADERARRFDYERGPLLRVSLFKLSPHRRLLTVALPVLCADAASLNHFVLELSRNYENIVGEQENTFEVMQYADFSEWQNELREAEDEQVEHARAFWSVCKANVTVAPTLPFEKKAEAAFSPATLPLTIDDTLQAGITRAAGDYDAAVHELLFASWQSLIWRLSGREDFAIFNLFDGRKLDDLKGALGLYDTFLPVRCEGRDLPFTGVLSNARQAMNDAHEWQEYFDHKFTRDQIGFDFKQGIVQAFASGLEFSFVRQEVFRQPFKIKLSCFSSKNGLKAELQYDAEALSEETVQKIGGYWLRLLREVTSQNRAIGSINILSEAEREQLLFGLNKTSAPFSSDKTIHQLFEEQAARTPDAKALVYQDRSFAFSELNARANQLARVLLGRGAGPNIRVGLSLDRGAEVIISLLAILKAGAAYIPLNPEHPPERLSFQLEQSNATVLVTNVGKGKADFNFAGEVIDLKVDRDAIEKAPQENPEVTLSPENLAYVIYTSGSTGVAKGVAVQHRNLVNYSEFILKLLKVNEPLHFATVSTITADLGNTCIFPSLISGGCLHVLSYETAMEADRLSQYVEKQPYDVLKIVPSHLQALLPSGDDGRILPRRFLLLGGEALSWDLAQQVSKLNPACRIFNHYGPTETTVGSLVFPIADAQSVETKTVPVGRPIANTRAYVLDAYQQPQPIGVAGELYIAGAGVAAGYVNQPSETANRFLPDPFVTDTAARMYRTGDKVWMSADGAIEFLGRVDNQLKVRGFRVEPGEVETMLATHPQVLQAIVVGAAADQNIASTDRLIAYVIPAGTKPPTAEELKSHLAAHLPDYMIPSAYVMLKSLPLTANGKVDRRALPAPDDTSLHRLFVAPRNETEKKLADIWSSLLKVDAVGIHDNFFELGGHSLLATQVVSRMRQVFQAEIPLRSLFETPTVAALGEKIDAAGSDETARLLAELDQLTDDEAERLLRAHGGE